MTTGGGKCFHRWLRKCELGMVEARMEVLGEDFAIDRVVSVNYFNWLEGGGVCTQGEVIIL